MRDFRNPNSLGTHLQGNCSGTSQTLAAIVGASLNAGTNGVVISANTTARYTVNGTSPTTTKGHQLRAGQQLYLTRAEADVVKFCNDADAVGNATLDVSQYS